MKKITKTLLKNIFYSTVAKTGAYQNVQLLRRAKKELLPPHHTVQEYFVPKNTIGNAGFSLNVEQQRAFLLFVQQPEIQALFHKIRANDDINIGFDGTEYKSKGLIHNTYYPTPDAEIYAAMIASFKPTTIIEVGSGFSTFVARATVNTLGLPCTIEVIDPQPRKDVAAIVDKIEYKPVEHSSLSSATLDSHTLLFIDSSHVCRSKGDLPFLFCNLLPSLPAGVLVHIHDIFTPYDYPDNFYDRFYTEQYLLQALLANSSKFDVVLATHYLSRGHASAMQAAFGPAVGKDPLFFGSSFWMKSKA